MLIGEPLEGGVGVLARRGVGVLARSAGRGGGVPVVVFYDLQRVKKRGGSLKVCTWRSVCFHGLFD